MSVDLIAYKLRALAKRHFLLKTATFIYLIFKNGFTKHNILLVIS